MAAIVLREGDPAEQILAYAATAEADFIVLGTHSRSGLRRWMSGSVTERVVRAADRPVIVVPEGDPLPFDRILCAVDLTDDSDDTISYAASVARDMGAHLIVVHAVRPPPVYEPWLIPPHDEGNAWCQLAVWMGFDDNRSLGQGETGARAAMPVFRNIIARAYSERLVGPVPRFPRTIEASIDRYLARRWSSGSPAAVMPAQGTLEKERAPVQPR